MGARLALFVGLALTVTACGGPTSHTLKTRFVPQEVAWSRAVGMASVTGRAVMTTPDGQTHTCANQTATLTPVSGYAREVHEALKASRGQITIANPDEAAAATVRTTTCDAQGRFAFHKLPPGDWYVRASVTWEVRGSFYATRTEGGVLSEPVTTRAGETAEIVLSR